MQMGGKQPFMWQPEHLIAISYFAMEGFQEVLISHLNPEESILFLAITVKGTR